MIKDNVFNIRRRIAAVCSKINKDPASITIVGVTKNRLPAEIEELLACGINEIGENRVQEAVHKIFAKRYALCAMPIKRHFIGHLQTNKVKDAVKIFDLIQSVDSLRLVQEIDKQAAKLGKIQDILLEVKTSPEAAKFGIQPDKVIEFIETINALRNLNLKGLMTIAPLADNPEETRPYFRILRELRDRINNLRLANCQLQTLSMGMSDDFEVAIEEGSNMVRIGRAIFKNIN